jgi:hypothetical protein
MRHGVHAGERSIKRTSVAHIGVNDLNVRRRRPKPARVDVGAERIHHPDFVTAGEELANSMLADETGASSDENSHACACAPLPLSRAD